MDISRRNLLKGKVSANFSSEKAAVSLPWLSEPDRFNDLCTRCGDCVDACPERIIRLDSAGFPYLNFDDDGCSICEECINACHEPLFIDPVLRETSRQKPWSHTVEISSSCLAHSYVTCRSCQDVCESQAIRFQLQLRKSAVPILDTEACTGCGSCVSVCPSDSISIIQHHGAKK